jgi:hypothetical protein
VEAIASNRIGIGFSLERAEAASGRLAQDMKEHALKVSKRHKG